MSEAIPAFVAKLWDIVNDHSSDHLIEWCKDGSSFVIKDPVKFCSELLPIYYKHNNMASFIRQLNKYGFKKVIAIDSSSLKNDKTDLEFFHPNFIKNYPLLLREIKRKISVNTKEMTYPNVMVQIAKEVQQLQQKQNIFESKLRSMKNENTALWREHSLLRHKHQNLQKLLNKLIQFLLTLVQQTRGLNIKRINLPLMIKDRSESLAAIKDHSHNQGTNTSAINGNLSNSDDGEMIVSDLLPDSARMINDFSNRNSFSSVQVKNPDPVFDSSSVVAVPLQEVSPAIVYGKYAGVPKITQGKTLLTDNIKKSKKVILDGRPSSSSKRLIKPKPSLASSSAKRFKPETPIFIKKDLSQPITLTSEKPVLKISKISGSSQPEISTYNVVNPLPETFENRISITQNINQDESVATIADDVTSIPIILSPSGTQLSPMITEPEKDEKNKQLNPAAVPDHSLEPLQKDIDNHIGAIQSDLDVLKDLLQSEGISIDASTLLGLMNEDPLSLNMLDAMGLPNEPSTSGTELVSYNTPSLLDIFENMEENDNTEYITPPTPTLNTPKPDFLCDVEGPSPSKRMKN